MIITGMNYQSKLWESFAASCLILYLDYAGDNSTCKFQCTTLLKYRAHQLADITVLRLQYLSFIIIGIPRIKNIIERRKHGSQSEGISNVGGV
jgi:hypothetical protein